MKIEYTYQYKDQMILAEYILHHSPTRLRSINKTKWIIGGLCLTFFAISVGWKSIRAGALDYWAMDLFLLMYGLFSIFFFPKYYRWQTKKNIGNSLRKSSEFDKKIVTQAEIIDDTLVVSNENSESKINLSAIEKYVEYKGYLFLFIEAEKAFVIDKSTVNENDLNVFINELKRQLPETALAK